MSDVDADADCPFGGTLAKTYSIQTVNDFAQADARAFSWHRNFLGGKCLCRISRRSCFDSLHTGHGSCRSCRGHLRGAQLLWQSQDFKWKLKQLRLHVLDTPLLLRAHG